MNLFGTRFNNELPQFVSPVPDPLAWAMDALSPGPGRIWTIMPSPSSQFLQSGGEVTGLPMQQNHPDCSRVAQHALVWGPSVEPDPIVPAQSVDSAVQPDPSREYGKPES